jgi:hypothetical protein
VPDAAVESVQEHVEEMPRQVVADAGYGIEED